MSVWWKKNILFPKFCFSNIINPDNDLVNPVITCSYLVAAGLLPACFSEVDLLRFALERAHISTAIAPNTFGCVDHPLHWELTPEGIQAAEQMGLLDAEPDATKPVADVDPPKATSGNGKTIEERGKGGNTPKNIWRKRMVQACLDARICGVKEIQDAINTYRDVTTITDDDGGIIDSVSYDGIRHDKDYIKKGGYSAYLETLKKKKPKRGNDAEMTAFKTWLRKNFKR